MGVVSARPADDRFSSTRRPIGFHMGLSGATYSHSRPHELMTVARARCTSCCGVKSSAHHLRYWKVQSEDNVGLGISVSKDAANKAATHPNCQGRKRRSPDWSSAVLRPVDAKLDLRLQEECDDQ